MKAIIPASGDGTRMKQICNTLPKELAEINGKPLIWYAIEECRKSNVTEIILILSKKKQQLKDYIETLMVDYVNKNIDIQLKIVVQEQRNGSGGAILSAQEYIEADDFCVLFPDVYIEEKESNLSEMVNLLKKEYCPIILVDKIDANELDRYGVTTTEDEEHEFYVVHKMIEKPASLPAGITYHGIVGRYAFPNSFLEELKIVQFNAKKEIDLSEALVKSKKRIAKVMDGSHFECGSAHSYLASIKKLAKAE